jgi:N-acetylneuraminic acid mutarotase
MLKPLIRSRGIPCENILSPFSTCVVILVFSLISLHPSYFDGPVILAMASSSADTPQKGSWITGAKMPNPRSEVGSAALNDKIYVVGGYGAKANITHQNVTDIIEVYDSGRDEWSTVASLPQPLDHPAVAAYDNKLYVIGGFTSDNKVSDKLYIYDPILNKWQEGQPMPSPRGALTARFIDGVLYAVGGENDNDTWSTNYAYDPVTNKWTEKAPMPTARQHVASAVVDGKLYVIGGRYSNDSFTANLGSNEVYDPKYNTWTSLQPMPTNRSSPAAASSVDGDIYVFGGELAFTTNTVYNVTEKYDSKTNKWTSEQSMPTARHSMAYVSINDRIFLIGGDSQPGMSVTGINEIFVVPPSINSSNFKAKELFQ